MFTQIGAARCQNLCLKASEAERERVLLPEEESTNEQHLVNVYSCFVELLMQFFVYLANKLFVIDQGASYAGLPDDRSLQLLKLIADIPINKQFKLL